MPEYEINIDETYRDGDVDEWGAAYMWGNKGIGVEYNICIDNGTNCSAFYMMTDDGNEIDTDYSTNIHYEIDFNDKAWRNKLACNMMTALRIYERKVGK